MSHTDRPWWTVKDAAALLRVNINSLYRAIAANDFPHQRWPNGYISIPAEALGLKPEPIVIKGYNDSEVIGQLELPYPVPVIPVRTYRNSGRPVRMGDFELGLSHNRIWRNLP